MSEKKKSNPVILICFALFAKGAKLLKLVKLFKVAKPVVLLLSMSVSAIAYTFFLGPWLSILFVTLLLIHEMGHVVAMRVKGFETPTPVFIPFFGAAIFAPKFKDRQTEAYVGFGGPLLGTVGTLFCFFVWFLLPNKETSTAHVVLVGSYISAYLNLFNMLPVSPLDGGRITQAVGGWFKYIGLISLAVFSLFFRQPVILYVWILVLSDLDIIPLQLRAWIVSLCWIAMLTLMSLGYGDQPTWINVIDCAVTAMITLQVVAKSVTLEEDDKDQRGGLPLKNRLWWLVLYFGLGAILWVIIITQVQFLPKPH